MALRRSLNPPEIIRSSTAVRKSLGETNMSPRVAQTARDPGRVKRVKRVTSLKRSTYRLSQFNFVTFVTLLTRFAVCAARDDRAASTVRMGSCPRSRGGRGLAGEASSYLFAFREQCLRHVGLKRFEELLLSLQLNFPFVPLY